MRRRARQAGRVLRQVSERAASRGGRGGGRGSGGERGRWLPSATDVDVVAPSPPQVTREKWTQVIRGDIIEWYNTGILPRHTSNIKGTLYTFHHTLSCHMYFMPHIDEFYESIVSSEKLH